MSKSKKKTDEKMIIDREMLSDGKLSTNYLQAKDSPYTHHSSI